MNIKKGGSVYPIWRIVAAMMVGVAVVSLTSCSVRPKPEDKSFDTTPVVETPLAEKTYQIQEEPSKAIINSESWELDLTVLGENEINESIAVISVSPSGKYLIAANQIAQNIKQMHAANIANPSGAMPQYLYIFKNEKDAFTPMKTIALDTENELEFISTLGVTRRDGVAWSDDESRLLITTDWKRYPEHLMASRSDIFLVDIGAGRIAKQTDSQNDFQHNILPQWLDDNSFSYIGTNGVNDDGESVTKLMSMNISNGEAAALADLSFKSGNSGKWALIYDYEIYDGNVFYSLADQIWDVSGLYVMNLYGGEPERLVDISEHWRSGEIKSKNIHSIEASEDGRWLCLSLNDQRVNNRDIPLDVGFGDGSTADARSPVNQERWTAGPMVMLYDIENRTLVDPFKATPLRPESVIVTAATFAPDGKSLLCAVFGDGGAWTSEDISRTTLYQIRLDDESFDAVRLYESVDAGFCDTLVWHDNNALQIGTEVYAYSSGISALIIPKAFEYLEN